MLFFLIFLKKKKTCFLANLLVSCKSIGKIGNYFIVFPSVCEINSLNLSISNGHDELLNVCGNNWFVFMIYDISHKSM